MNHMSRKEKNPAGGNQPVILRDKDKTKNRIVQENTPNAREYSSPVPGLALGIVNYFS